MRTLSIIIVLIYFLSAIESYAASAINSIRCENLFRDKSAPDYLTKKMVFYKINPGKFMMGDIIGFQVETEITRPFEMMDRQVTQMMWARLKIAMGEKEIYGINPSHFKYGTGSVVVNIEGIDVQMKPNHPVESVSWLDVRDYINGLNKLSAIGDSQIQVLLEKLLPGHRQGDLYDLPTSAQWEFVMRDRGHANKMHFERVDEADVRSHSWYSGNSERQTHEVATLKPRLIDGNPFYDLEGNVFEFSKNWIDGDIAGGKDPEGAANGFHKTLHGGSWSVDAEYLTPGFRSYYTTSSYSSEVGFRLIRIRKKTF